MKGIFILHVHLFEIAALFIWREKKVAHLDAMRLRQMILFVNVNVLQYPGGGIYLAKSKNKCIFVCGKTRKARKPVPLVLVNSFPDSLQKLSLSYGFPQITEPIYHNSPTFCSG